VTRVKDLWIAALCSSLVLMIGCGHSDSGAQSGRPGDDKVLNLYDWADDVAPDTISSFEKLTGIKVRVSYFDSNETLRTRMLTGNSGFDVVVPSVTFLKREILSGAYLSLDKKKLPNLMNLDPAIMAQLAPSDPGNTHAVVYMWGTVGIGYNEKLVTEALPNVPLDSWRLYGTDSGRADDWIWPIFAGWSSRNPPFGKLLANQLRPSIERSKPTLC
jgi:putrescine transport system substrate-binding protein